MELLWQITAPTHHLRCWADAWTLWMKVIATYTYASCEYLSS